MNRQRLLERFLRYVRIDTTACDEATCYPSSAGQWELGKLLVEELHAAGIADAAQDTHGIVLATVPATVPEAPTIALCAHLDTSPETSGAGVRPQVIPAYAGGDIVLPGDPGRIIRVADNPELVGMTGKTLVTSDGTTLLGGDDKAGVAILMEMVEWLREHPEIPRGPVRLCFTCDEEIGHGVDHLDPAVVGAVVCYTLDSSGVDRIDVETFSADRAIVRVRGVNIHPSIGKDRMVNAVRVAADFVAHLPSDRLSPETTEGRQGFLHPYEIEGGVGDVRIKILLRDFDTARLAEYAELLRTEARACQARFPGAAIDVSVETQYRNMADGLAREPRAVALACRALERLGRTPQLEIVRGGTDGSRLTELGLPTPNLATGQYTPHSPLEWVCLDEMVQAVEGVVSLVEVWSEEKSLCA